MTRPKLGARPADPSAATEPSAPPARKLVARTLDRAAPIPSMGEIGLNHFAPYLLNRLLARWNGDLSAVLAALGLNTTQFRALSVLAVSSGITVNELAIYAVTEQSTMSRTLDGLEEQGLIRRKSKPGDARVREVYVTEAGLALFASVWPEVYRLYTQVFAGVGEEELSGFVATLHKLMRNGTPDTR